MPSEILVKNTYTPDCKISLASIVLNFAFNLPHYATSYVHGTGKKESKKEIKKKKEKKTVTINLVQESVRTQS